MNVMEVLKINLTRQIQIIKVHFVLDFIQNYRDIVVYNLLLFLTEGGFEESQIIHA